MQLKNHSVLTEYLESMICNTTRAVDSLANAWRHLGSIRYRPIVIASSSKHWIVETVVWGVVSIRISSERTRSTQS